MIHLLTILIYLIVVKDSFAEINVIIIYREDVHLYRTVVEEITKKLNDTKDINVSKINIDRISSLSKVLRIEDEKSYFFLTVGDLALKKLVEYSGNFSKFDHPGHFIFLSDYELLSQVSTNKKWIGMTLNVPFRIQFELILNILENIKSIGILYTDLTENLFKYLIDECKNLPININGIKITDNKDIIPALIRLYQENDLVYLFPDSNLSNKIIMKRAILLQFQYKKPLLGIGVNSVSLGATTSVNYNLDNIVRIISNSIKKYLTQKKTFTPDCCLKAIVVYYNPNTINKLGIKFNLQENIPFKNVLSDETP